MKELWDFTFWMLRPRAIKWWWRLGEFECVCWSYDYHTMTVASRMELWRRTHS